jgi:hypothetical protein
VRVEKAMGMLFRDIWHVAFDWTITWASKVTNVDLQCISTGKGTRLLRILPLCIKINVIVCITIDDQIAAELLIGEEKSQFDTKWCSGLFFDVIGRLT